MTGSREISFLGTCGEALGETLLQEEKEQKISKHRSARHSFGGPRSVDGWWDWRPTTMLEGLYQGGLSTASMPGAQPHQLLQTPCLPGQSWTQGHGWAIGARRPMGMEGWFSKQSAVTTEAQGHLWSEKEQKLRWDHPEAARQGLSCPSEARLPVNVHFESPAARAALTGPRASGWIDQSPRAVSMHFTLYSPPTQLFSSVSLSAEMLPTGGLTLSSLLESVTILCRDSAPLYHLLLPELVFLVLSLTHLCFHFYGMIGILLSRSCRYHSEPFLPREPIW
ncbi:polycystin-1-like protein 1 [Balaenoptera ricei]|uniref:polycystin-1-like protein 1 n=1 Tax=Balaenoptera ricei TaxID=2746895 RepID=UPI0028BEB1DE|nr:polycystin-1-like protein 1 [Balaenoptera ricei]